MVLNINLQKHQNCFADGAHEAEKCDIDAIESTIVDLLGKEMGASGTLESLTFDNRFIFTTGIFFLNPIADLNLMCIGRNGSHFVADHSSFNLTT